MVICPPDSMFLKTRIANHQFPTIKTYNCYNFRKKGFETKYIIFSEEKNFMFMDFLAVKDAGTDVI